MHLPASIRPAIRSRESGWHANDPPRIIQPQAMTPFGARIRALRQARGIALKQMAADLGVSSAYLSALEHGHRGRPSWLLLQRICGYLNIIWDDAEELAELAKLSHPRITIDTAGLTPKATLLANELSRRITDLDDARLEQLLKLLRG